MHYKYASKQADLALDISPSLRCSSGLCVAEAGWHLGCLEQREQTSRAVLSTEGPIDLKEVQQKPVCKGSYLLQTNIGMLCCPVATCRCRMLYR